MWGSGVQISAGSLTDLEKVQVIAYRNPQEPQFLLLHRIPDKGGFWQPVTGAREPEDDTLRDAALRELREETGLAKNDITDIYEDIHSFTFHETRGHAKEVVYAVRVKQEAEIDLEKNVYREHDMHRWVSFEEAITLVDYDGQREGLRKAKNRIEATGHHTQNL